MDANFWYQKWEKNEIAFHEQEANPLLVKYCNQLSLAPAARVFVPLCGKTRDIHWLLSQGHAVVGAELSRIAIDQLYAELEVTPIITTSGKLTHYSAANLDIFVGNIFDITPEILGAVDAVYDRAALVALPEALRRRYAAHLLRITANAPQLLICYDYDQSLLAGPPFSISDDEVFAHYQAHYKLTQIANVTIAGGLKGKCPAQEKVWLLN